ncbi:MAG: SEC-C metal-binding domain-containing protein [Pseudonocardiaceae bacterium]
MSQLDKQVDDRVSAAPPATPAPATPVLNSSALGANGLTEPQSRPLTYSGPAEGGGTEVRGRGTQSRHRGNGAAEPTVVGGQQPARNEPCPCGSGRKYKRCHGAPTTTPS